MATYSSILDWKIPGTQERGGLQSMGSQRVKYGVVTKHHPGHFAQLLYTCVSKQFIFSTNKFYRMHRMHILLIQFNMNMVIYPKFNNDFSLHAWLSTLFEIIAKIQ